MFLRDKLKEIYNLCLQIEIIIYMKLIIGNGVFKNIINKRPLAFVHKIIHGNSGTNQYIRNVSSRYSNENKQMPLLTINSTIFSRNSFIKLTDAVYLPFPIRQHYNAFANVYFQISRNMFCSNSRH